MEKFRAIPPTDADDISQSTLNFWPILAKNCWGNTSHQWSMCHQALVTRPLPLVKF